MAEGEDRGFLSRWSQRKAEARQQEVAPAASAEPEPDAEKAEAVDLDSLPPIEELTAAGAFTAFLRNGVPDAFRRAALRRLWACGSRVVHYGPLVEYAWHNYAPGFGPLLPTGDVEKLRKQIVEGNPSSLPPE